MTASVTPIRPRKPNRRPAAIPAATPRDRALAGYARDFAARGWTPGLLREAGRVSPVMAELAQALEADETRLRMTDAGVASVLEASRR
jgi:hypothetical protein